MRREVILGFLCLFFIFIVVKSVYAEVPKNIKIVVIDIRKVVNKSKYGEEVMSKLKEKYDELSLKIQAKSKELEVLKEELEKKGALLTPEAREKKQSEYQRLLRELKSLQEDAQYEMQEYERKLLDPVFKDLEIVLKEVAQKEGIDLVLEKNQPGIYYMSPSIDFTDKLIERFDAYYEKIKRTKK